MERVCKRCGAVHHEEDMLLISGEWYCDECYDMEDVHQCPNCEKYYWLDDCAWVECECDHYCQDCLEREFAYCDDCGEYYPYDEVTWVDDVERYVCENCLERSYNWCERCETYHHENNSSSIYLGNSNYVTWCTYCRDDHAYWSEYHDEYIPCDTAYEYTDSEGFTDYVLRTTAHTNSLFWRCSDCGTWYYDTPSNEVEDNLLCCNNCFARRRPSDNDSDILNAFADVVPKNDDVGYISVNGYHTNQRRGAKFFCEEGEQDLLGFELEAEPNRRKVDDQVMLRGVVNMLGDRMTFEHDSSINGIEFISQVHSIKEFYQQDWGKFLDWLCKCGWVSHDSGNCGLHVHLNRGMFGDTEEKREKAIGKMIMFYEKFYDLVVKISRRKLQAAERWAKRYFELDESSLYRLCSPSTQSKVLKDASKKWKNNRVNRYKCVNTTNENTIEIRIMRGTLRKETFYATIDFILTIAKNSTKLSWEKAEKWENWLVGMKPETLDYINSKINTASGNEDCLPF